MVPEARPKIKVPPRLTETEAPTLFRANDSNASFVRLSHGSASGGRSSADAGIGWTATGTLDVVVLVVVVLVAVTVLVVVEVDGEVTGTSVSTGENTIVDGTSEVGLGLAAPKPASIVWSLVPHDASTSANATT